MSGFHPRSLLRSTYGVISLTTAESEAPDDVWDEQKGVSYVRGGVYIEVPEETNITVTVKIDSSSKLRSFRKHEKLISALLRIPSGVLDIGADFNGFTVTGAPQSVRVDIWGHKKVAKRTALTIQLIPLEFTDEEETLYRKSLKESWPHELKPEIDKFGELDDAHINELSTGDIIAMPYRINLTPEPSGFIYGAVLFSHKSLALLGVYPESDSEAWQNGSSFNKFAFVVKVSAYPASVQEIDFRNPVTVGFSPSVAKYAYEEREKIESLMVRLAKTGSWDLHRPGELWAQEKLGRSRAGVPKNYEAWTKKPALELKRVADSVGITSVDPNFIRAETLWLQP